MRRGFTIIELLVASMLLGMLVTILTMVFNQSSISWRIGVAGVADMDDLRDNMAELRDEADNAFAYGDEIYRSVGLWKKDGSLRSRACDADNAQNLENRDHAQLLRAIGGLNASDIADKNAQSIVPLRVGQAENTGSIRTYTVNVMSGGPKNDVEDWQAIWSFPDDPNEW